MKVTELKAALTAVFSIGRTPNIIGLHGTGKSSVVYQWAAENGYKVSERRLGQMADAGDLIGLQEFIRDTKTGNATHTKHVLPDWFPREENTIVFLDEVNRAHKDLLQAVFELVYDKSLAGVKLPKNCHVVAASNPATDDYAVLDFSDSAFQDRFVHIQFTPTKEEWLRTLSELCPIST
jgi:MoxR-like ATPase